MAWLMCLTVKCIATKNASHGETHKTTFFAPVGGAVVSVFTIESKAGADGGGQGRSIGLFVPPSILMAGRPTM
ncbi:MAG: hypothetical protein IIZ54_04505 [Selenomonadaceae bacterium]|nr:hypothetical protein [Selenomonadaceae bacterium]